MPYQIAQQHVDDIRVDSEGLWRSCDNHCYSMS